MAVSPDELLEVAARARVVEGDVVGVLSSTEAQLHQLVAWAWVFDADLEHVLLVHHRRFQCWMPPGGLVEPGETPLDAARRELVEETGLDAPPGVDEPLLIDAYPHPLDDGTPAVTIGIAYRLLADPAEPVRGEPGQPAEWHPLDVEPVDVELRHWARLRSFVEHAR